MTHGTYFTIYPPGFVPYGRARLAPPGPPRSLEDWGETAFAAAVDAARGHAWSRAWWDARVERLWWTQVRQLDRAGAWLGLVGDRRTAERAARALGLGLATHHEARRVFQAGGYRGKGRAVGCVLEAVPPEEALGCILRCGQALGSWGRVWGPGPDGGLRPLFPAGEGPDRSGGNARAPGTHD